jgi:hypothetical protein
MNHDVTEFERELLAVLKVFVDRQRAIHDMPVRPSSLKALSDGFREPGLAEHGGGLAAATREFLARIAPGLANTAVRDFSLVIGGPTPAAVLGDVLTSLWDPCVILHDHDSIAPVVEDQTALLLLDLFELRREDFVGTFTTGGAAANLIALDLRASVVGAPART